MPSRWQPSLEDSIDIAAYLLGAERAAITALPRLPLAELATPARLSASLKEREAAHAARPSAERGDALVERVKGDVGVLAAGRQPQRRPGGGA